MPQFWFEVLSAVMLAIALLCSASLLVAVVVRPRAMAVMNWVWPVTALYWGPIAVLAYRKLSRPGSPRVGDSSTPHHAHEHHSQHASESHGQSPQRPFWQTVFVGVTHCGAGCTLGDLIAEWVIFAGAVTFAGTDYWPEVLLDFALAWLLGVVFQYFAVAPMRGLSGWPGIWAAIQADTLSLAAFEVGLFLWMALFMFVIFPGLRVDNPAYWFMMQIGMVIGFATSYPMNWWLIRRGIKEAM